MVAGDDRRRGQRELVIAHPEETLHGAEIVVGQAPGPAIYLRGVVLLRLRMAGSLSPSGRRRRRLRAARADRHGHLFRVPCWPRVVMAILVGVIAAEKVAGAPPPRPRRAVAAGGACWDLTRVRARRSGMRSLLVALIVGALLATGALALASGPPPVDRGYPPPG